MTLGQFPSGGYKDAMKQLSFKPVFLYSETSFNGHLFDKTTSL